MEHMLKYLPKAIQIYIPMNYIQSGDNYEYVVKKDVIILKNDTFSFEKKSKWVKADSKCGQKT